MLYYPEIMIGSAKSFRDLCQVRGFRALWDLGSSGCGMVEVKGNLGSSKVGKYLQVTAGSYIGEVYAS